MLSAELLAAYRQTDYRVFSCPPLSLRIGQPSTALQALHLKHRVCSSAFITACNPHSQLADSCANQAAQESLARALHKQRLHFIAGLGVHPYNGWPAEPSYLVLGIGLEQARQLGRQFEQNAILFCGQEAMAQLILLQASGSCA